MQAPRPPRVLELQADQPAQPARALPAVVQEQRLAAAQEQQVVRLLRVERPEAAPAVRTER